MATIIRSVPCMDSRKRVRSRIEKLDFEKKKKLRRIHILIIAFAAILVIMVFIIYMKTVRYKSFGVTEGTSWTASINNKYIPYRDGVIKYNRDGAQAMSANGNSLWNVAYNMKDPMISACGPYAAVAERGGKKLVIIDGAGKANHLNTLHGVSFVSVSDGGITVVMTDNGMENMMYVYTMDSRNPDDYIDYGSTNVLASGFPLDMAISSEGKKIAVSFLSVHEDVVTTGVTFYNLGSVGKNKQNHVVGWFMNDDGTFSAKVKFLNKNTALVLKENGFTLYDIPEIPSEIATITVNEEIRQVAYGDAIICLVAKSDDNASRQKVYCYNLKGAAISTFYMDAAYDGVMTSGNDIVFYSNAAFYICDGKGNVKFQGELQKSVKYIYPINDKDRYLLIGEGYMDTLRLLVR